MIESKTAPSDVDPERFHQSRADTLHSQIESLEGTANRFSIGRLGTFLVSLFAGASGCNTSSNWLVAAGAVFFTAFLILVVLHARLMTRLEQSQMRHQIHHRHLKRVAGTWTEFTDVGSGLLPKNHAYASDLDLIGRGSLFQRVDTSHTILGAQTLARWLGSAADAETIRKRAEAVRELRAAPEFLIELEAATRLAGKERLDHTPFLQFTDRPSFFTSKPFLELVIHLLPALVLALFVANRLDMAPVWPCTAAVFLQATLLLYTSKATRTAFDLIAARRGYIEAFRSALVLIESASWNSPLLQQIQDRVRVNDKAPSSYLRQLDRWAGLAELRTQFPINILANVLLLWDLHVLLRLERWNAQIGGQLSDVFQALGETEALASFAALAFSDPDICFAALVEPGEPLEAVGLTHPLISPCQRVANDVSLAGPGSALIVTGSNMAGKSTLLRALGLNVALALAGGPSCAKRLRLPIVRLRASMRADDSLQHGASYFHAELTKLQSVIKEADQEPRILFLLDELLRGTNAKARHVGARAILEYLLERQACGLVATHDVALSHMEQRPNIQNVHFTDIIENGEMTFDYRLRSGVVRTSNALRLLELAGITIPDSSQQSVS